MKEKNEIWAKFEINQKKFFFLRSFVNLMICKLRIKILNMKNFAFNSQVEKVSNSMQIFRNQYENQIC